MRSSSYVSINLKSKLIADYFNERMDEIEESNEGWNDVRVEIDGSSIKINSGDCDADFVYPPRRFSSTIKKLLEVVHLYPEENEKELSASIEELIWESETYGIDGDDGSYDKKNYDKDVLEVLLVKIAEENGCTIENITDEVFYNYVKIEADTVTETAKFEYYRSLGKSTYYYSNRMHIEKIETDENIDSFKSDTPGEIILKDKIFVLTGFDEDTENRYVSTITQGGGIIKSSTVLKTNYLIFNPDYDHETLKLKRAKELNSQGKEIAIIAGKDFENILNINNNCNVNSNKATSIKCKDYELSDNETGLTVVSYIGKEIIVNIPDTINGVPVTKISEEAFSSFRNGKSRKIREKIEEITIPDTVIELGANAFCGCFSLKRIRLSKNITELPDSYNYGLFFNCSNLEKVTLPPDLIRIGSRAFMGCSSLKSIDIPESVKEIGDRAFAGCKSLKELIFPNEIMILEPFVGSCENLKRIVLPEKIIEIKESAFALSKKISEIVAPNKYIKIGEFAFHIDSPWFIYKNHRRNFSTDVLVYIGKNFIGYKSSVNGLNLENIFVEDGTVDFCDFIFEDISATRRLHLPNSINLIDNSILNIKSTLTIYAPRNSCAEQYAKENNIPFVAEEY